MIAKTEYLWLKYYEYLIPYMGINHQYLIHLPLHGHEYLIPSFNLASLVFQLR